MHKLLNWAILFPLVMSFLSCSPPSDMDPGLISIKSNHSARETADRFESILAEKGLTLFQRIDHAEGARKVGQELRPTELIIFGNPKVGTPLMKCGQSVGIDLPQKALVWEDKEGQVWLTYNDPNYLAERHGITGCGEIIKKIETALSDIAEAAMRP